MTWCGVVCCGYIFNIMIWIFGELVTKLQLYICILRLSKKFTEDSRLL